MSKYMIYHTRRTYGRPTIVEVLRVGANAEIGRTLVRHVADGTREWVKNSALWPK